MDRRSLRRFGIASAVFGGFSLGVLLCLGVALVRSVKPLAQLTADAAVAPMQDVTPAAAETPTPTVTATPLLLADTPPATDTTLPTDTPAPSPTPSDTPLPTDTPVPSPTTTGTLLPTDTPSPSATPTSTLTPTPTPMTLVVRGATDHLITNGDLHVVGEVENGTSGSITDVKIVGTFYNSSDQVVAVSVVYALLDVVGAVEVAPFDLAVVDPPSEVDHYDLQVEYAVTDSDPLRVGVLSHQGSTSAGDYHVLGEVRNHNSFVVDSVRIIATFYNAQNEVIGAVLSYTALDALSQDQTTAFEVVLANPPETVDHYALLAEADRQ